MCGRCAKRALALCTLDIDMDPLPITGADCELIDAILTNRDPL